MSKLNDYEYLYNQRIPGCNNKLKAKTIVLPRGTLLFSGIDSLRTSSAINMFNDFKDIYTRGTFKKQKPPYENNGPCHYGTFNKYTNYAFFHPCPCFAQNVANYAQNMVGQGCFVLKSDIRLLVLMGNETKEQISQMLQETEERYTRYKMRSFANNDASKIERGFIVNTPNFVKASNNSDVREGTDPMIDPEIVYEKEINGYITNATLDSNIVFTKPIGPSAAKEKREVGLHALIGNSEYKPKYDHDEFNYQKKYLNMFSTFTEGSTPNQSIRSEISFGIPEIVLMGGSIKYMKEVIQKPKSMVDRNNYGQWIYRGTDNTPRVSFTYPFNNKLIDPSLKGRLDNFSKHLRHNTDYEERCNEEIILFPEDDMQIKELRENFNYGGGNYIDRFSIFTQNRNLDPLNIKNDMQIMEPLFCAGSPSLHEGTPQRVDHFYNSINQVMKQFFTTLSRSNGIIYDNYTGFMVLNTIFDNIDYTNGSSYEQPFSSGKGTKKIITNRGAYKTKWFNKLRTFISNDGEETSNNTFWILHPKWSPSNKKKLNTKLEDYYHYNVNWYKNKMDQIQPLSYGTSHKYTPKLKQYLSLKNFGDSMLKGVILGSQGYQGTKFYFAFESNKADYNHGKYGHYEVETQPAEKIEGNLPIGNPKYTNIWNYPVPKANEKLYKAPTLSFGFGGGGTASASASALQTAKSAFTAISALPGQAYASQKQKKQKKVKKSPSIIAKKPENKVLKENKFYKITTTILSLIIVLYIIYSFGLFSVILGLLSSISGGILGGLCSLAGYAYNILTYPAILYPGILFATFGIGVFKTEYEFLLYPKKKNNGVFSISNNNNYNSKVFNDDKTKKTSFNLLRQGDYRLAIGKVAYDICNFVSNFLSRNTNTDYAQGGSRTQTMTMTNKAKILDNIDGIIRTEKSNSIVWVINRENLIVVVESFKDSDIVTVTKYEPLISDEFLNDIEQFLKQLWSIHGDKLKSYIDEETYFSLFSVENISDLIKNSTINFGGEEEGEQVLLDNEIELNDEEDGSIEGFEKLEAEIEAEVALEQEQNSLSIDELSKVKNLFLGSITEEKINENGISDKENKKLANKFLRNYLLLQKTYKDVKPENIEGLNLFDEAGNFSSCITDDQCISRKGTGRCIDNECFYDDDDNNITNVDTIVRKMRANNALKRSSKRMTAARINTLKKPNKSSNERKRSNRKARANLLALAANRRMSKKGLGKPRNRNSPTPVFGTPRNSPTPVFGTPRNSPTPVFRTSINLNELNGGYRKKKKSSKNKKNSKKYSKTK